MQVVAQAGFKSTEDIPVKLRLNHLRLKLRLNQPDLFIQAILTKFCKSSKKQISQKNNNKTRKTETKLVLDVDV